MKPANPISFRPSENDRQRLVKLAEILGWSEAKVIGAAVTAVLDMIEDNSPRVPDVVMRAKLLRDSLVAGPRLRSGSK